MAERGIALVVVLVALVLVSVVALSLALTTATERLAGGNYAERVAALDAADAALELAVRELARIPNWTEVLTGALGSSFVDGVPGGPRWAGGTPIDLTMLTNQITCGRVGDCSDARVRAITADRPWGTNNPRWRLFLYGPLGSFVTEPDAFPDIYVVAWAGDDARELDGDPLVDGGAAAGRDALRVFALAFAPGGTRQAVEADIVRSGAGIRVQSWRVRTVGVP